MASLPTMQPERAQMPRAGYFREHCARGHPYTPENTRMRWDMPVPVRVCRKCDVLRVQAYRRRTREARG
jgi:hypothetical protein